jgi:MFS family permease
MLGSGGPLGATVRYGHQVTSPAQSTPIGHRPPPPDWRRIVTVFWVTQLVESLGMSQVFALMPKHLQELGVADADRVAFVGLFNSLVFVFGLPLVPLWGVWADKISRKAVIARSALVEAGVFTLAALAHAPWQMALALLLIGFQLGNTGVMLAGIRDVTPRARLGTVIALFGAAGPVGIGLGQLEAGVLIDGAGWSIAMVYGLAAVLSIGTAVLVAFGTREIRPEVIPEGPVLRLAFGAVRGVLQDKAVRSLFLVYGVVFLANQVSRPYVPLLVERLTGTGPGLATGIALVVGLGALIGALASPLGGMVADRIGFRPVLLGALVLGGVASAVMPLMPGVPGLVVASLLLGTAVATTGAMVFSLLATEVPPERRSATLNLVYLPLYLAGIVGPATGSAVAAAVGLPGPFVVGGAVFLLGAIAIARRHRASSGAPEAVPAG